MVDLVGVAVQAGNPATGAEPKASVVQEGLASEWTEVLAAEKVSLLGSSFKGVIATPGTDRDPVWSADGKQVVFTSDYSGIFNVYALDLETQTLRQITNVAGGAFNPTVGSTGDIFFASYTAKGFEIRHLSGAGVSINVEGQGLSLIHISEPTRPY